MEPQPQDKPLGAPEHLDVPFELKTVEIVTHDDGAEVGVFEGLASTFGNRDMMGDLVEPGALSGALARPGAIKMLWQHDARAPIGVWERVRETAAGLEVKGRLVLDVQQAREAFALLKAGAVDALSIGFSVLRGGAEFDRERSLRRIKAVDLCEISVVTFPANPKARVARIKAADVSASWGASRGGHGLPTEREFERLLMRDAGLSRSQARRVLSSGYKALLTTRDAGGGLDELVASVKRVTTRMAAARAAETPRPRACGGPK